MKRNYIIIAFVVIIISANLTIAQPSISGVSMKFGIIQNYNTPQFNNSNYIPYYEIQLNGNLVKPLLRWGVYFSYWDDGIDKAFPVMGNQTYSFSGKNVGLRMYLDAPQINFVGLPLRFSLFGGVSHSFINSKYVGGIDYAGQRGSDYSADLNNAEIGIGLNTRLFKSIMLFGEAERFIVLNPVNTTYARDKNAFTFGFVYSMN
jgi:hypothetical protein